jgi:hypothetical protein
MRPIPERIFVIAGTIISASRGEVTVDRALLIAERIVTLVEEIGRTRFLEIICKGGEA